MARHPDGPSGRDPAGRASGHATTVLDLGHGVAVAVVEVTWRFSTAGGPGGQHVNTSNTRAEAVFEVGASPSLPEWARRRIHDRLGPVVSVAAADTRSQTRNRELALERLRERLAAALEVPKARRATRPTKASQRRRLEAKRRHGDVKRQRREPPSE